MEGAKVLATALEAPLSSSFLFFSLLFSFLFLLLSSWVWRVIWAIAVNPPAMWPAKWMQSAVVLKLAVLALFYKGLICSTSL